MNIHELLEAGAKRFKRRNLDALAYLPLQTGRIEKWFVPEFAYAMNLELTETDRGERWLARYVDTGYRHVDVTVWDGTSVEVPVATLEAKVVRRNDDVTDYVRTAGHQLAGAFPDVDEKVGLFLFVFAMHADTDEACQAQLKKFHGGAKKALQDFFPPNHRLHEMTTLTALRFPGAVGTWRTQSWLGWGRLSSG